VSARPLDQPNHDKLLARIARELLHWSESSWRPRWIPSDESDVFELDPGDGSTRRIVKIERPDMWCVRREIQAFPALRARGFSEFPEVEWSADDLLDAHLPFLVTPKAASRPLPELWTEDRRLAMWTTERIGDFLHRLAVVPWIEIPGVVRPDERVGTFSGWFASFFAPLIHHPTLSDSDRYRIDEVLDAMTKPPTAFGGWQFAQVLTDGKSAFTAIDWGNLGAYWPLHDLAAAICSLDNFGPDAPPLLREPLLDAFTGGTRLDSEQDELLQQWLDLWEFFGRAAELHNFRA
jgi:hypothetical protein